MATVSASSRRPGPPPLGGVALTIPGALALLLFFVAPLGAFLVYSFLTAGLFSVSGPLTLDAYREALASQLTRELAVNSIVVGLATASVTLLVSLPVAYWLRFAAARMQVPVLFLIATTFFASYLVRIYAWRSILGESGLLNSGLTRLGLVDEPLGFLLYNRFAVCVALVHIFAPYVVLVLYAGLRPVSPGLLEAAQDLGAGSVTRWRRVVLPLVAAPAATAFLFVFILAASDYVTPQFLGGTNGSMVGVQVQTALTSVGDWPLGAAVSFLMLAAFLALYALTALALRVARLDRIRFTS